MEWELPLVAMPGSGVVVVGPRQNDGDLRRNGHSPPPLPSLSLYACFMPAIHDPAVHALRARMPIPFFPQDSFPFPLCFAGRRLTTALLTRETEEAPPPSPVAAPTPLLLSWDAGEGGPKGVDVASSSSFLAGTLHVAGS